MSYMITLQRCLDCCEVWDYGFGVTGSRVFSGKLKKCLKCGSKATQSAKFSGVWENDFESSCTLTVSSDPAEKVKSNKANEIDPQQR